MFRCDSVLSPYLNYCCHLDGYNKLSSFHPYIHGCIDFRSITLSGYHAPRIILLKSTCMASKTKSNLVYEMPGMNERLHLFLACTWPSLHFLPVDTEGMPPAHNGWSENKT